MTEAAPGTQRTSDDAAHWRAAERLRREHPRWVVIWLASAHSYRAYPLFRAPRETALTAATPEELADQMNQFPRTRAGLRPDRASQP